jgi:hypothetical protein
MIRSVVVALVATLFAVQAAAQTVKQVEVANFPDPQNVVGQVEVTNLPAPPTVGRFQLVGFTTDTVSRSTVFPSTQFPVPTGHGIFAATTVCQSEFPESRICSKNEVLLTTAIPSGLSGEGLAFWVNHAGDFEPLLPVCITAWGGYSQCVGIEYSVACCAPVP